MSNIRVVTYRLDIYNLHTKIVSFADQEKSLKEVVLSLAVSMNTNRKSSNIAHVKNMLWYKEPTCTMYRPEKHLINEHELKVFF